MIYKCDDPECGRQFGTLVELAEHLCSRRPERPFDATKEIHLYEGACLICERPRSLDPTQGGCACIGPTREQLVEIDARLSDARDEDQFAGCAGILAAIATGLGLAAAFFLVYWLLT